MLNCMKLIQKRTNLLKLCPLLNKFNFRYQNKFIIHILQFNSLKIEYNLFIIMLIILGIGDWGLGIGDWGLGPIPNPQSPIPNPQSPIPNPQSPYKKVQNYS